MEKLNTLIKEKMAGAKLFFISSKKAVFQQLLSFKVVLVDTFKNFLSKQKTPDPESLDNTDLSCKAPNSVDYIFYKPDFIIYCLLLLIIILNLIWYSVDSYPLLLDIYFVYTWISWTIVGLYFVYIYPKEGIFYYLFLTRAFLLTYVRICLLYILKKNCRPYDKIYNPLFSPANLNDFSSKDLVNIIKKLLHHKLEKNLLVVTLVSFFCYFMLVLEVFLVYLFLSLNSFFKELVQTKSDESFGKPFPWSIYFLYLFFISLTFTIVWILYWFSCFIIIIFTVCSDPFFLWLLTLLISFFFNMYLYICNYVCLFYLNIFLNFTFFIQIFLELCVSILYEKMKFLLNVYSFNFVKVSLNTVNYFDDQYTFFLLDFIIFFIIFFSVFLIFLKLESGFFFKVRLLDNFIVFIKGVKPFFLIYYCFAFILWFFQLIFYFVNSFFFMMLKASLKLNFKLDIFLFFKLFCSIFFYKNLIKYLTNSFLFLAKNKLPLLKYLSNFLYDNYKFLIWFLLVNKIQFIFMKIFTIFTLVFFMKKIQFFPFFNASSKNKTELLYYKENIFYFFKCDLQEYFQKIGYSNLKKRNLFWFVFNFLPILSSDQVIFTLKFFVTKNFNVKITWSLLLALKYFLLNFIVKYYFYVSLFFKIFSEYLTFYQLFVLNFLKYSEFHSKKISFLIFFSSEYILDLIIKKFKEKKLFIFINNFEIFDENNSEFLVKSKNWVIYFYFLAKNFKFIYFSSFFFHNFKSFFLNLYIYLFFFFLFFFCDFFFFFESYFWNNSFYLVTLNNFFNFLLLLIFFIFFYFKRLIFLNKFDWDITFWLFFTSFLGVLFLSISNNFISFFVSLELVYFPLYLVLYLIDVKNSTNLESSWKFLTLSSCSSALLIFSITLIFSNVGSLDFNDIFLFIRLNTDISSLFLNLNFFLGSFLFFIAIFIKFGFFPFHFWVVDLFFCSSPFFLFYFSIFPKIGFFLFFLNFFSTTHLMDVAYLNHLFFIVTTLNLFFPTILSFFQNDFRKILAYGSIFSTAMVFTYFLVSENLVLVASSFYVQVIYMHLMVTYYISLTLVFLIFLILNFSFFKKKVSDWNFDLYKNSSANNSFLSVFIVFVIFNFSGFPPFIFFWGKFFLFHLLFLTGNYLLLFILLFCTVLSLYFYTKIIVNLLFYTNLKIKQIFKIKQNFFNDKSQLALTYALKIKKMNLIFFFQSLLFFNFFFISFFYFFYVEKILLILISVCLN